MARRVARDGPQCSCPMSTFQNFVCALPGMRSLRFIVYILPNFLWRPSHTTECTLRVCLASTASAAQSMCCRRGSIGCNERTASSLASLTAAWLSPGP